MISAVGSYRAKSQRDVLYRTDRVCSAHTKSHAAKSGIISTASDSMCSRLSRFLIHPTNEKQTLCTAQRSPLTAAVAGKASSPAYYCPKQKFVIRLLLERVRALSSSFVVKGGKQQRARQERESDLGWLLRRPALTAGTDQRHRYTTTIANIRLPR